MDIGATKAAVLIIQRLANLPGVIIAIPLLLFPFIFPYLVIAAVLFIMVLIFRLAPIPKVTIEPLITIFFTLINAIPAILPGNYK